MALDVPDCAPDEAETDEDGADVDGADEEGLEVDGSDEERDSADDSASVPLDDSPCPEDSESDEDSADSATGDEIPDSEPPSLERVSDEIEEDDSVDDGSPPEPAEVSSEHPAMAIKVHAKKVEFKKLLMPMPLIYIQNPFKGRPFPEILSACRQQAAFPLSRYNPVWSRNRDSTRYSRYSIAAGTSNARCSSSRS